MTTTAVDVWHFAADKLRDGRPLPKKGDTLKHEGKVVPCGSGLHGSKKALDALWYAPGAMVARCELRGTIVPHDNDKLAASERHYLTGYVDASRVLHEFACWCATRALDRREAKGHKADPRSRRAIEVKLLWLDGKATDAELEAAWDDAWDGALAAARAAAWNATRAAMVAWAAARDAAWAAACDAAWAAARDEQNAELERRLLALMEGA